MSGRTIGEVTVSGAAEATPGGETTGTTDRMQIVLDTSVLLADPSALTGFPGADVIIPVTVIEELDSAKSRLDDQGAAARQVVRLLETFRVQGGGNLQTPQTLPNDSSLRVELNGMRLQQLAEHGLRTDRNDNRILAAALGLAHGGPVTLVSADVNLRVKAAALGLLARDWHPTRRRNDTSPGWREVVADKTLIDALYQNEQPAVAQTDESPFAGLKANEYLVMKNGSQSVLARYRDGRLQRVNAQPAWGLAGRSKEQIFALDLLTDTDVPIIGLSGAAGTGKTILALAAGLEQVFEPTSRHYDRLIILRPVQSVGGQDLGFLPGTVEEKLGPWFDAVIDALVALGDRVSYPEAREMVDTWVAQGRMSLDAVTYLRGRSLRRSFVIVDEAQNLEQLTLKTILTRIGSESKVVFLGDTSQIDNPYVSTDSNALSILVDKLDDQELFGHLTLTRGERSPVANLAAELL